MRKFFVSLLLILGMAGTTTAQSTDSSAPSYDLKAQALLDLEGVQKKFVDLANAVPADKFAWKPSEDTRSFAEVLMHVAGERYQILRLMGATPPADFNGKTFEKLLPKLGPQANAGDVVYILVADAHEHLGQAITYARVNGVVPPWTVEAQKKAAEKKAQQK
jgi:hypothetical protein